MDSCVQTALAYIRSKPELVPFVREFDEPNGFMFSSDPRVKDIDYALEKDGHSGASFTWCMRQCQRILKEESAVK